MRCSRSTPVKNSRPATGRLTSRFSGAGRGHRASPDHRIRPRGESFDGLSGGRAQAQRTVAGPPARRCSRERPRSSRSPAGLVSTGREPAGKEPPAVWLEHTGPAARNLMSPPSTRQLALAVGLFRAAVGRAEAPELVPGGTSVADAGTGVGSARFEFSAGGKPSRRSCSAKWMRAAGPGPAADRADPQGVDIANEGPICTREILAVADAEKAVRSSSDSSDNDLSSSRFCHRSWSMRAGADRRETLRAEKRTRTVAENCRTPAVVFATGEADPGEPA